jgi:hypothetical protein
VEKIELVSRQKSELPDLTIYDKTISELEQALQPMTSTK